jgi:RecQ family ATP-dependent DNA helicase
MALTATANEKVKLDIKHHLHMNECMEFAMSFNRKNLIYEIRQKTRDTDQQIVQMINERWRNQSGIIYCTSKRACEQVAETLRTKHRLNVRHYHAGLEKEDRMTVQNKWASNEVQIIVATVAFGMGIDKPDVRFVIHYSLPQSIEGYYQETGRCGRDGGLSHCVLFYSYKDKSTIEFLIDKGEGNHLQKERQRENLRQVLMFCENKSDCRRQLLMAVTSDLHFDVLI